MKKSLIAAVVAASASFLAAAPAAAEPVRVQVPYGDIDLATAAGAQVLAERVTAACERPDMRNIKAMGAWERCKDAALAQATEQLGGKGTNLAVLSLD